MFCKFCPQIHGICTDGHPDNSDHLCIFWDSLNEECSFAKSVISSADQQRTMSEFLRMKIANEEALEEKIKASRKESE